MSTKVSYNTISVADSEYDKYIEDKYRDISILRRSEALISSKHKIPLNEFENDFFIDNKDGCVVVKNGKWHLYGSAFSQMEKRWKIHHCVADSPHDTWKEELPIKLCVDGPEACAPGVIVDHEGIFHMFLQTSCFSLNGKIEHLTSSDGYKFKHFETVLESIPNTKEAGIYDPHPALIGNKPYIVYSGFIEVCKGSIYLLKSVSGNWYGPWEKVLNTEGNFEPIIRNEEVSYHNQLIDQDFEWGLEGSQLIELPNGIKLLNAVCFCPTFSRGMRQRVFFAAADNVNGPYTPFPSPVLNPTKEGWESGENGHASIVIEEAKNMLHLFYQARSKYENSLWRYGHAIYNLEQLQTYAYSYIHKKKFNLNLVTFLDFRQPVPALQS